MRKLVFQEFISIDDFAAGATGSTTFLENPAYAVESDDDLLKEMDRFGTILPGANTYKMFAGYWPMVSNDEQIVADKLDSIPKIVFSKTLVDAPWGKWEPAKIIKVDAVTAIGRLKHQPGKDMVLWGSISLAQPLMRAHLIDEYQFRVVPERLGKGIPLFQQAGAAKMELIQAKRYESGLLLTVYKPAF